MYYVLALTLCATSALNGIWREFITTSTELEHHITWGTLSRYKLERSSTALYNKPFKSGFTPLTLAVFMHRQVTVSLLIRLGADPNLPDARGKTPLEVAIEVSDVPMFKYLTQHGALLTPEIAAQGACHEPLASYIYHSLRRIRLGSRKDGCNKIGCMEAAQASAILSAIASRADSLTELKREVAWGADVNFVAADGESLVDNALHLEKPELIRYALTQGLSSDLLSAELRANLLSNTTPFYQSYMVNREHVYETLVRQIKSQRFDERYARFYFTGPYRMDIAKLLPQFGNLDLLCIAAQSGNFEAVKYLLTHSTKSRFAAMQLAAAAGYEEIYWWLRLRNC